ncbi:hypothetical protein PVN23_21735 [Bacillus licheniformis]|uniref:hypothetical protein n=1 Tax=Bacillus licheniformis TaxID=1402 RepID=UPI00237C77F5|nr:hypothetical protein [Bacillus licheniformis]MDE1381218.1 hypothetical protein [Bacillus licheniformis]
MAEKVKKPFYKRVWFWVVVAIVVIGAAGANSGGDTESASTETKENATESTETKATETKAEPKKEEKKEEKKETNKKTISMEEFEKIENGMTKEEVEKLIGGAGTLDSSAGEGQYKTEIYSWEGDTGFGANANVTFQDGKVQGKAQFGLDQ